MRNRIFAAALVIGVVLFELLPSFAKIYTEWLGFGEVGHEPVFLRTFGARLTLGVVAFASVFGALYPSIRLARTALKQREFTVFGPQGARTVAIDMRSLRPLFYLVAAAAAVWVALYVSARWQVWLMALNAVPFGKTDPILRHDVSFYLFELPLLHFLNNVAVIMVLLSAACVIKQLGELLKQMNSRQPL